MKNEHCVICGELNCNASCNTANVSESSLNGLLSFDLGSNYDITFCSNIHTLLKASGFNVKSSSNDEEGESHCIEFAIGNLEGRIHTECGKIVDIETF